MSVYLQDRTRRSRRGKRSLFVVLFGLSLLVAVPAVIAGTVLYLRNHRPAETTAAATAAAAPKKPKDLRPGERNRTPDGFDSGLFNDLNRGVSTPWAGFSQSTNHAEELGQLSSRIDEALDSRDVLVVWLLDQSPSFGNGLQEVKHRIAQIARGLPNSLGRGNRPDQQAAHKVLYAVAGFGASVTFAGDEPTDDLNKLDAALDQITTGTSGEEKVFTSIKSALDTYEDYRTKRGFEVLLVAITDEAGNDQTLLDELSARTVRLAIPVFVVGTAAPFGSKSLGVASGEEAAQIVQGPESVDLELLALPFMDGTQMDFSAGGMQGGFMSTPEGQETPWGPYSLAYLCQKSGGAFLAVPYRGTFFDPTKQGSDASAQPDNLRKYAPKYVPRAEYDAALAGNAAWQALVKACKEPPADPRTTFGMEFNAADEQALKRNADTAQRIPARNLQKLERLQATLLAGESARADLTEPRLQAGYDLALGRVLAMTTRLESYVAMLAELKRGKVFKNGGSTVWQLRQADEISVGSAMDQRRKKALALLEGVIANHPGTPWAEQAKRELKTPLGWAWNER